MTPNNRLFLVEKGHIVVISQGDDKTVSFGTIEEFNKYCSNYNIDLTEKYYIDYEPDRGLYLDSTDPSITTASAPNALYDAIIADIDAILSKKNDPYFGITLSQAIEYKVSQVNGQRAIVLNGGYLHTDGYVYDTHQEARDNFSYTFDIVTAGATLPQGFTWRTQGNVDVPHDNASFLNLYTTMQNWRYQVIAQSWAFKAAIESLMTVDAVKNFEVEW